MERSAIITIGILLLILVGAGGYVWYVNQKHAVDRLPEGNIERAKAAVHLTDFEGNPVSLSDFHGQVVVANVWASWCPFCVNELPDFAELAREYAGHGVVVVAINRAESRPQIEAYLRTVGALEGLTLLLDESDSFYSFIGGFSMPETIFYDVDGNVVLHKRGYMRLEEMRQHVETALSGNEEDS